LKLVAILSLVGVGICWFGFFMVATNQGRVQQLFGQYVGSERTEGLRWANPLYMKAKVSLRVRNFESGTLKVNDSSGNPIDIAAVVVWKVVDTAEALFEVDDYENYVQIQSEAALRNLATTHPYDSYDDDGADFCLRSNPEEVAELLKKEVQNRLSKAGVEVIEARLSHLAYAPEIANAMLQRQQASAIVAARKKIVEGAVGMVDLALAALSEKEVVTLDEERKAAMVSNLLVVLCGESSATPVVNTGSLYT
jgi:regulator of protease activity HflC (stomatin/prohibitin superfamily)